MNVRLYIKENYLLWIAIVIAALLRYVKLDFQSLWLDEIYTMNMGNPKNNVSDIYALSQTTDPLSLLYFILLNFTFKIVGYTSFVARFFSLLFGLVGILVIYKLGNELRNKTTGLIAAFLLSVNYFHLFYSQEARVYTMFMMFTCLSFLYFIRFLKNPSSKTAALFGLGSLLMVLSHFFGLFTLMSQLFIILLGGSLRVFNFKMVIRYGFISGAIIIIGFIPVIPILLVLSKVGSTWISPITNRAFSDLYCAFFGDSHLIILFSTLLILYYLFSVFNYGNVERNNHYSENNLIQTFSVLLIWILITFFIPYFRSFLEFPMLHSRYLISILPPFILMIAIAFDLIKNNKLKIAFVSLFLIISFLEIWIVKHYYKNRVKSDFKAVTKFLVDNNAAQSNIVTSLPYHFNYYLSAYENTVTVEGLGVDEKIEQIQLNPNVKEPFWFLEAHGRLFSPSEAHLAFLKNNYIEALSFQSFDSWTKYFIPKSYVDSNSVVLKINAVNFYEKLPYEGDNNLYLNTNTAITSKEFFITSGSYKLVLHARSTPAKPINGEHAHLNVFANKIKLSSYFLTGNSFLYGDTLNLVVKENEPLRLKIEFDNDIYKDKKDRNVVINELLLLKN